MSYMMIKKEWLELLASYKLLVVPMVFFLLAIMQPVTIKMLPQLLKNAGGLPEGTIIEIPTPPVGEIAALTLLKFDIPAMLVIVLISMATIAGERQRGVAAMILVKPVGRTNYYFSKFVVYSLLVLIGGFLALTLTATVTESLFGPLPWPQVLLGHGIYLVNLLFVVAVSLCCSAFIKSPIAAGGLALLSLFLCQFLPSLLTHTLHSASPKALTEVATTMIKSGSAAWQVPMLGTLLLTTLILLLGWQLFLRQEI